MSISISPPASLEGTRIAKTYHKVRNDQFVPLLTPFSMIGPSTTPHTTPMCPQSLHEKKECQQTGDWAEVGVSKEIAGRCAR